MKKVEFKLGPSCISKGLQTNDLVNILIYNNKKYIIKGITVLKIKELLAICINDNDILYVILSLYKEGKLLLI